MLTALSEAVIDRRKEEEWTNDTELLATIAELLYSLTAVTVKAHGGKDLPRWSVKRPNQADAAPAPSARMGFGQFARGL